MCTYITKQMVKAKTLLPVSNVDWPHMKPKKKVISKFFKWPRSLLFLYGKKIVLMMRKFTIIPKSPETCQSHPINLQKLSRIFTKILLNSEHYQNIPRLSLHRWLDTARNEGTWSKYQISQVRLGVLWWLSEKHRGMYLAMVCDPGGPIYHGAFLKT